MSRRGMNIYKRKDGRWEGRFKNKSNGKYCSLYGKSYGEVREKLMEKQKDNTNPVKKCNLTVKELFELWAKSIKHKIKLSSYANYMAKLETHIYPELGSLKYNELTGEHINSFVNKKLTEGRVGGGTLSAKYVSDIIALLKSLRNYAQKNFNYQNQMLYINSPTIHKKELSLLNRKEQSLLKSRLVNQKSKTNAGVLLCLFTGIRLGELCALKWSDIDLKEQSIRINKTLQRIKSFDGEKATELSMSTPKSKSSIREIPLPLFLCKILSEYKEKNEFFFLSGNEKAVEPRLMQYYFKRILKTLKLPDINFHFLRHIFATNCIECGFDVKTLSEILGHSKIEITLNLYVHSSKQRKKECMNLLKLIS